MWTPWPRPIFIARYSEKVLPYFAECSLEFLFYACPLFVLLSCQAHGNLENLFTRKNFCGIFALDNSIVRLQALPALAAAHADGLMTAENLHGCTEAWRLNGVETRRVLRQNRANVCKR